MNLKGRIALVTGASRGIGRSIALKLAQNEIHVVITGRDKLKLTKLEKELVSLGTNPLVVTIDISKPESIGILIDKTIKKYNRLDILINNAGFALAKPMLETTFKEWENVMAVNARAPFFICQKAIPHLIKSDCATIINISSVVGRLGYENQAAYAATKHALMGFSKVMAKEVQSLGIRVHTIAPGGVETDMVKTMRPDLDTSKLIKPEEIAEAVDFLIKYRGNAMIDNINIRRANGSPFA